jgi:MYXO-CTERM domain-containing protein
VWKLGRRVFRGTGPSVEGGRPNRSFFAVLLAGAAGALTFWRKRRSGDESS